MTATLSSPPNILFLVFDALRKDYAEEYASTLNALAADNLWFENAIAPAPWSLPSHASIFRGVYPHEHGAYRNIHTPSDANDPSPLLDALDDKGYRSYGLSANGFASIWRDFDKPFDEFYETGGRNISTAGLNVSQFLSEYDRDVASDDGKYRALARAVLTHGHPLGSMANVGTAFVGKLLTKFDSLQRIPHPLFHNYALYNYSAQKNTAAITEVLEREAETDSPFFLFANYMDTHRPYDPPAQYQERHLGRSLTFREITELNDDHADTWEHAKRVANDDVDEDRMEQLRGLYAGEVEHVDDHLGQCLEALDAHSLRENTLIVVTSDHGENLGEVDAMGRERVGHHVSLSDVGVRVPLVIAHPDLDGRVVDDYVSLKDLFHLWVSGMETLLSSRGADLGPLRPDDGIVVCESPAVGGEAEFREHHPDVPDALIDLHTSTDAIAGYKGSWRIVLQSDGASHCWHDGAERELAEAPDELVDCCERYLAELAAGSEAQLSDEDVRNLEALGYI
jgi:arylsulfatase A-like enzyme